jgi:translation initiation factor 3 subunit I
MRPILLKGHERSITQIKYGADGDIIFTFSKDSKPMAWWTDTGERLGTYNGHQGAVWSGDVTPDTRLLLTGSADSYCKMWNVMTGECLVSFEMQGPVRAVRWAEGGKRFLVLSFPLHAKREGASPLLQIFDMPAEGVSGDRVLEPWEATISVKVPKSQTAEWMPFNRAVMVGGLDGKLRLYDPVSGSQVFEVDAHEDTIFDIQFNADKTLFITSSKDCLARLFDTKRMRCLKKYHCSVPVNSASIHPKFEHVMIGGGQDAMNVTTTAAREGGFEVRFHKMISEEIFGTVKGHFGPINSLAFHPFGTGYASGSEDGFIRIHVFDDAYMNRQAKDDRKLERDVKFADDLEAKVKAAGGQALRVRKQ